MTPLIEPPSYTVLFYVTAVVVFGQDVIRETRRRGGSTGENHDHYSVQVITFASIGGFIAAIASDYLFRSLEISWHPRVLFIIGILFMLMGGIIRKYAARTLDQYFTSEVRVRDGQEVVDTGPYRWVRHPSYIGGLLAHTGVGIVLANWVSIIVIALTLLGAYGYRIHIEERTLQEQLGEPYQAYLERTPYRLVPYLW
jgi:protein-S-isoprenylcysteine O-methyltransferase Ste14